MLAARAATPTFPLDLARDALFAGARALGGRRGRHFVALDFAPAARDEPRWGHGRPPHPILSDVIAAKSERFRQELEVIASQHSALLAIPRAPTLRGEPFWL